MIPAENSSVKEVKNIQAKWVHLGNLAYTVAWCKCTMMHHSEDCTDGASSWTVGACRLHQSVTGVWCGGACTKRQGWLHQLWYPVRTHTYCGYAFIPSKSTLSLRELSFLTGKWGSAGDGSGCHTSPYVQMCQWLSNQVLIPHIGPFK